MQLPSPEALFNPTLADHAYLFDLDGTLIAIAEHPDAVLVPPLLPALLSGLRDRTGGAVAIISGRSLEALEALLPVSGLALAGLHGLQHRLPGEPVAGSVCPSTEGLGALRPAIEAFADQHPGVLVEDKGAALAIHYRARTDLAREVRTFADAMAREAGEDVILLSGKCVEEIRVRGPDKGDALMAIMQGKAFRHRKPVYFGDDFTDEAAFGAAAHMGGIGVLVGSPERRTAARARVPSSGDVLRFMARLTAAPAMAATAGALQWR
jgi:trehalose 6-phosphate phosphatase